MRPSHFFALVASLAVCPAWAAEPRDLGRATVVAGPSECAGQTCYTLDVACPEVLEDVRAELRVADPAGTAGGTILFTTGGGGGGLWERFGPDAARVLVELRDAGFQIVQLSWPTGWLVGSPGQLEGHARLACRPATVVRWVFDTLHAPPPAASRAGFAIAEPHAGPFCTTGNSGGSAQISYMLTDYGLADELAAVVPTGGPPMGRIDLGCLQTDPAQAALWYSPGSAGTTDRGFGFDTRGDGPCFQQSEAARPLFEAASLAFGDRSFVYPRTMVWFVNGENDVGNAVPQGLTYYERLLAEGSPLVRRSIAPGTPHATPSTRAGAEMIRDILLAECRLR